MKKNMNDFFVDRLLVPSQGGPPTLQQRERSAIRAKNHLAAKNGARSPTGESRGEKEVAEPRERVSTKERGEEKAKPRAASPRAGKVKEGQCPKS